MSLLIRRDATLRNSGALHLAPFEQPRKDDFFNSLLNHDKENFLRADRILFPLREGHFDVSVMTDSVTLLAHQIKFFLHPLANYSIFIL